MKKTIFLIDGGFFSKLYTQSLNKYPDSEGLINFIRMFNKKYNRSSEIFRIYYYDCFPLEKRLHYPISNIVNDLKKTTRYKEASTFLNQLKREDFVSLREGVLADSGWKLNRAGLKKIKESQPLTDSDFSPNISQKGVDIKIGLDIAWISLNKISERVVLVTGDSDFIPAMKFARRNGVQVYLSTLNHGVTQELKDHSDVLVTDSIKNILNPTDKEIETF